MYPPRKLDTYVTAPTDPAERRRWADRRNVEIQDHAPAQATYGAGKGPEAKPKKARRKKA